MKQIQSSIPKSNFFDEIEYIPLESGDHILIDSDPHIVVNDDYIVTMDSYNCFVFDRNGKFLRKIGSMGRGPNEYRTAKGFVDSDNKKIYLLGWNFTILEYDYKGHFHRSIPVPEHVDNFANPSVPTNYTAYNNKIVAYFTNVTGTEKKLFLVFTPKGEIIRIHGNPNIFQEKPFFLSTGESHFYEYNNRLFFNKNYKSLAICPFNNCFINDVDGFITFNPMTIIKDRQAVGYIDGFRVEQCSGKIPEKQLSFRRI